ncbi:hypothetical protein [Saccharibacillus sp. JS10]|uniref:hypothetical protein n=1 Tax=Saccharibacillus sp. JS10 TaxID=2950552 RepID=UPI002109E7E5|nr:hypothetical protein [Saccharibacillus sp. JS10]MCQ4086528.1 hypothetical protein [Saccharibacillus sp. JS10]
MKAFAKNKPHSWISNKKRFVISIIGALILGLISLPYPGTRSLFDEGLLRLNIPIFFEFPSGGRFHYISYIMIFGVIALTYLCLTSLKRYRIVIYAAVVVSVLVLRKAILMIYLAIFPSPLYAVDLNTEQSWCNVSWNNDQMTGECNIIAKNYSREDLQADASLRIYYKGGSIREFYVDTKLDPMFFPSREVSMIQRDFTIPAPDGFSSDENSGIDNLLKNGDFRLILSDGDSERSWGDTWLTDES